MNTTTINTVPNAYRNSESTRKAIWFNQFGSCHSECYSKILFTRIRERKTEFVSKLFIVRFCVNSKAKWMKFCFFQRRKKEVGNCQKKPFSFIVDRMKYCTIEWLVLVFYSHKNFVLHKSSIWRMRFNWFDGKIFIFWWSFQSNRQAFL